MNISDAIIKLHALHKEHGDIPLMVPSRGGEFDFYELEDISFFYNFPFEEGDEHKNVVLMDFE